MQPTKIFAFWKGKKALAAPFTAVSLLVLLIVVALVVDLGRLYIIKAELQNAADAGASAGATALFMPLYTQAPGTNIKDPERAPTLVKIPSHYPLIRFSRSIPPPGWQPFSRLRLPASDGVIRPDVFGIPQLPGEKPRASLPFIPAAVTGPVEQTTTYCDFARAAARAAVEANKAVGQFLTIPDEDIDLGTWSFNQNTSKWGFVSAPCSNNTNAVKVVTRKKDMVNGPVFLIFARILGLDTVELSAQCIAMLGWVKGIGAGRGTFPLALGDKYVPPPGGQLLVTFSPNGSDTGCWHTFFDPSADASDLKRLVNGTTPSPEIKCEDYINVTNGVATSVIGEVQAMFEAIQNGLEGHNGAWTVILPVISSANNYVQSQKVKGFCAFKITEVNGPPAKTITGYSMGGYIVPDTVPGGPDYGLKATQPKLVH